jgi:hypothetical protein
VPYPLFEARITSVCNKAGVCLQEIGQVVRNNVTIDWMLRQNVQAWMWVMVKPILRRYGYPPEKQEKAT